MQGSEYNHLRDLNHLAAEMFIMRHGLSKAIEKKLVVSDIANGRNAEYGLTEEGRQQVKQSALRACSSGLLDSETIIFSSPFSRAIETADLLANTLSAAQPIVDNRLRERFFGTFNLSSTDEGGYEQVWRLDAQDPQHTQFGVESVLSVLDRLTEFFLEMQRGALTGRFGEKPKIVAVCHGDPGQIVETGFQRIDPGMHRTVQHFEVAEIRRMLLPSNLYRASISR